MENIQLSVSHTAVEINLSALLLSKAFTGMNKLASHIITLGILIFFSGCSTLEKNHLKAINNGMKPTVSVVANIDDKLSFTFLGSVIFQNATTSKPSSMGIQEYVQILAETTVSQSSKVKYIPLSDKTKKILRHQSPNSDKKLSEDQIRMLATSSKEAGVDYLLLIKPDYSNYNLYNPNGFGILRGVGIFDDAGFPSAYLYAYLEFDIIDTANSSLTDRNSYLSYQLIPIITRSISDKEYKDLEAEWVQDSPGSLLLSSISSFEEDKYWMAQFLGKDYQNIEAWQVKRIEKRLPPVIESAVNSLLAGTGLIDSHPTKTVTKLKASEDRLWPLLKSEDSFSGEP